MNLKFFLSFLCAPVNRRLADGMKGAYVLMCRKASSGPMRVSYTGITSAFQADERSSILLTRLKTKTTAQYAVVFV